MKDKVDIEKDYLDQCIEAETWSGLPLKEVYKPADTADMDYERDIGDPGHYPFVRGIYDNMYRGRYWTRREVTGFGGASDTNKRLIFQAKEGVSGFNVIPDNPTHMGIDQDHPMASTEAGLQGVALPSIKDMEALVDGLDLDKITIAFNIRPSLTCAVILAQYLAVADQRGIDRAKLAGTLQEDPLGARWCGYPHSCPIDLSLKISADIIEFCTKHVPRWNTGNINMYAYRETGINAAQELAFGFALALAYIDAALDRGLQIDDFVHRRAFYAGAHIDFFEEIAKFRAARRMWARLMKEKYKAQNPRSWKFKFGVHTEGVSLVPQEPLNNIIRVSCEALAAVIGGAQSIHTCSYDEPVALPTEQSARLAIRTQQILAFETGVARVVDPMGGSWYVEHLTNRIEDEAGKILAKIEDMGGAVEALKSGWFDSEMDQASQRYQEEIESGQRIVVGVNAFKSPPEKTTPGGVFRIDPEWQKAIVRNLRELKANRDSEKVKASIAKLREEAERGEKVNLMPAIIEAVKSYATLGEIIGTIRQVYGYAYDPLGVLESPFD